MPIIKEVRYNEDNPIDLVPELDEEEKHILAKKQQALGELLARECIGKYKIEILFSYKRSQAKPTPGALSLWESGAKLHGGGDTKIYLCPGARRKVNDCVSIVPFDSTNYGFGLCPGCGKVWKAEELDGEVLGVWTMQTWAEKLVQYYTALGHNADIYIKQPRHDIRKAAQLEQEKQLMGDKLGVVRTGYIKSIYPLKRIIDDVNNGADLYSRFYAFLKQ